MSTKDLSKMGRASVHVIQHSGTSYILKQSATDVEINFYQFSASKIKGMNTPRLLKVEDRDLYIEFIPHQVSLQALQTNTSTYKQLARLHGSECIPAFATRKHEWNRASTERALKFLNLPDTIQNSIESIQSLSAPLFNHSGLISGDTNDGNWRTRANSDLVLFDWERFGYGSPAIDLAPLVQGLGNLSEYQMVIEQYIQHNSFLTAKELEKQIIIAKCWIIIEVTNLLISRNNPEASKYINWYRENIPTWLVSVEKTL